MPLDWDFGGALALAPTSPILLVQPFTPLLPLAAIAACKFLK